MGTGVDSFVMFLVFFVTASYISSLSVLMIIGEPKPSANI